MLKHKWISVVVSVALALSVLSAAPVRRSYAAAFAPGNLVIYRVGDGSGALTSAATPVFLDEYTTGGALVQSIPLRTAIPVDAQKRLTASGTATSEGLLTLSEDLNYLTLTGYDAAVGTATVAATASITTNRVIGRVGTTGIPDTSTAISDTFSGGNIRSAVTDDGTQFWATGSISGTRYVTFGGTTSSDVSTTGTNLRYIKIARGQLYVTTGSGTIFRLGTVGVGKPTTTGQTITNIPGGPTSGSPYSFYLADLDAGVAGFDTLYLTDDTGGSGIQKYSLVSGSWTLNGTIALPTVRGLTGVHSGSAVTLYATNGITLSTVTDSTGYNFAPTATPTTLATRSTNTAFRGVAFVPGTSPTAITLNRFDASSESGNPAIVLLAIGLSAIMLSGALIVRRRRI